MRERPILFSSPMVRALLEGRKTQTRRVVKPGKSQAWLIAETLDKVQRFAASKDSWWTMATGPERRIVHCGHEMDGGHIGSIPCPYGAPGDRLWVRETWNLGRPLRNSEGIVDDEQIWSKAIPKQDPRGNRFLDDWCLGYAADGCEGRMRAPLCMPRWASRLTLELSSVRVERLQDISEADAVAEGLSGWLATRGNYRLDSWEKKRPWAAEFKVLWDSLNAKRAPWASNPWVWVLEFRRVTP